MSRLLLPHGKYAECNQYQEVMLSALRKYNLVHGLLPRRTGKNTVMYNHLISVALEKRISIFVIAPHQTELIATMRDIGGMLGENNAEMINHNFITLTNGSTFNGGVVGRDEAFRGRSIDVVWWNEFRGSPIPKADRTAMVMWPLKPRLYLTSTGGLPMIATASSPFKPKYDLHVFE